MRMIFITIVALVLSSCSAIYDAVNSSQTEDNRNIMLTEMAVYSDKHYTYYATNGKELKIHNNSSNATETISVCSNNEMIQDIFADESYIYYAKQTYKSVAVIQVDKNNLKNENILFSFPHSSYTFGTDYIYAVNNCIYFYNSADKQLFYYKDNMCEELLSGVTSVTVSGNQIFYSDIYGAVYEYDIEDKTAKQIWDINEIANTEDEELTYWYNINMSEATEISQISCDGNLLRLLICNNVKNGLMVDINAQNKQFSYNNNMRVNAYQYSDSKLYYTGSYFENNSVKGVFEILSKDNIKRIDADSFLYKYGLYICNHYLYIYENSENEELRLKRINLLNNNSEYLD